MSILELIKKLEYIISFQNSCLREGNWDDFDKAEDKVRQIEQEIVKTKEN
jgi:hypothetical protein